MTSAVKWPPELPLRYKVMFTLASISCVLNPAIWLAELQSIGRLRLTKRIHHRPRRPTWTTLHLSAHGYKRYYIPWYALAEAAMSARDLHHLLTSYGIKVWVWSVDKDGTWSIKIKRDQAVWAEYLMLRRGVWPNTQLEPETRRQYPALLQRMAAGQAAMPKRWSQKRVWTGSLNEIMLEFGLIFPPLVLIPFVGLAELPLALARLVEFRTEHVHHVRRSHDHPRA